MGREEINQKIISLLVQELKRAALIGSIDYEDFKKYVINYGISAPTSILNIPVSVLERLIDAAIESYKESNSLKAGVVSS